MTSAGGHWVKKVGSRVEGYLSSADLLAAKTNLIAFVVGANGPLYPVYLFLLIGRAAEPTLLTMLASPLFLAIPALSRRYPFAGRIALPLVGTLNTMWCAKLLGLASGVELFLLPCISIAVMSFRQGERYTMLLLAGLPMALYLWQNHAGGLGAPLLRFTSAEYAAMLSLNIASVGVLTAFLGLAYAGDDSSKD
jgi:hypothetical protein